MNKFSWFFVQWCFLIIKSSAVPDVTLVLQKLPGDDSNFNMTCVLSGENLNSGIAWILPTEFKDEGSKSYVSKYVPDFLDDYSCKRNNQKQCINYWKQNGWNIQNSLETNLDVVTDSRWEEFPIIYADGKKLFNYVFKFPKTNKFTINFSIRVKNEAHIFLSDTNDLPYSGCYWILLGGYAGKKVAIRKCANRVPNGFGAPGNKECKMFREEEEVDPDELFNQDVWKHFMLAINKNNIILKSVSNNKILFNYTDNEKTYINMRYLHVRSNELSSYWKFHTYDFWYTTNPTNTKTPIGSLIEIIDNRICISLYVAMCSQCRLIISVLIQNKNDFINTKTIVPIKELTWQEVKINMSISTSESYVQLYAERLCSNDCHEQFWAIDNFRRCTDNEVRVLNVKGNALKSSFQILASPSRNMNIKASTSVTEVQYPKCDIYSIGSTTCTNCTEIFGNVFCKESIICDYSIKEEGICRCSPGYTGRTCQTECSPSFYGNDCKERCGFCQDLPCHFITGNCPATSGCHSGFRGAHCKIPPYPVLNNPPSLVDFGYFYITIQINDFTYFGSGKPDKFVVRYELTNDNTSGLETQSYQFPETNRITLTNLKPDTSYIIRVILLTSDNEFYNGTYGVKSIVAKTTCADIQEDDIEVHTTTTEAVFSFKKKPELCPLKNYEVKFITDVLDETNNEFRIPNLNPYTNYMITIRNINNQSRTLYYNFKTQEEVPSAVLSFEVLSSSATSLTISWREPLELNGRLRHYKIKYQHLRYLACSKNDSESIMETITHNNYDSTETTLDNLTPYSEYIIKIAAVTVAAGNFSRIKGETAETDVPDENEIPLQISVQPSSTEAKITLEQAKCSLIKGQIEYYISARCKSTWCLNNTIPTLHSNYFFAQQELNLKGLLPYSMYIVEVKVGRTNKNLYKEELQTITFKTLSAAPNEVKFDIYEESEDILRLRITPPYPPTGELEQYTVKYCEVTNKFYYHNCRNQYSELVNCKLWTDFHCVDISQDLKGNQLYRVYVQARNKDITTLGPEVYEVERTKQRSSYAPEELSYSWDNYYNLTLQWKHPYITNGPLEKFVIKLQINNMECYRSDYMVSNETIRLRYNNVFSIENKDCYTSPLIVTIQSFNKVAGQIAMLEKIYSPPETPALMNIPSVDNVSNTTITIELSAKSMIAPISFMYIVLSESKSKLEIGDFEDFLSKLNNSELLAPSWLIKKYNLRTEVVMEKLTIGSNNSKNSLQNDGLTLTPNTSYTITILMYNEYQQRKRYRVYEIVQSTTGTKIASDDPINVALFSLILIVLLPLLVWMYIRKRKTGKWCSFIDNTPNMPYAFKRRVRRNPDVIPLTKNPGIPTTQIIVPAPVVKPRKPPRNNSNNSNVNKVNGSLIDNKFSKPIKITDFDKYVKDSIMNGELERQHSLFIRGQTKPWDYGALPQNKSKNRYNNLVAYDHTRVKLEKINDDPYSDYINANYIEGYKSKNAYIATQGPKVATLNDFWRMIWQDNVKYIVMLANVIEGGKKKTEQYWPNINETIQFGNISVKYISTVVSADYEYRTFLVTSNNTKRQIEQLHFTSWPDHGVPMYSQSLVPLFRKLLTIPQGNSPIVVHCSAGVGRTGTVILADICLRMSAHEGAIDVLKHQYKIREQRPNLVDNLEQYKLVHLVLLECLINPDTSIVCDEEAEKNILRLLETDKLEKQFHFITEIAWQDQAMRPTLEVNQKPEWKEKNRVEDICTSGYGRVYLSRYPLTDEHSDYINAVEVDGFKAPNRFIATQQPLPNTISDFWRMVDEKDVTTIVTLNSINKDNNRSCVFWPTSKISEIEPVPYLLIKFINKINNEEITKVNIELYNKKSKDHTKRNIILIKLKDWPANTLIPNSNVSLLKLWTEAEKVSQNEHPIIVTCHDGATSCGLFLAFTFVIEKIKLEHQCDVCLAVRTVRHNREQFVQKLDQFKYLYRAAIEYLSDFELYANFS